MGNVCKSRLNQDKVTDKFDEVLNEIDFEEEDLDQNENQAPEQTEEEIKEA